jgi:glycosyltransferase involved in cell wall biosynthesis
MKSLHLIASAHMGGAERWFVRFLLAMQGAGETVQAVVRQHSELHRLHLTGIPHQAVGFRTVWDPWSRYEVGRLVRQSDVDIVQTYMGRATRLTHLPINPGKVHVARLGGYYALKNFRHAHAWIGNTKALCDWMVQGGLPKNKVWHIGNFADPAPSVDAAAVSAQKRQFGIADSDIVLLTAGRFVEFKGHRFLLESLQHLPTEIHGRRLRHVIIGDGPLRASLHAYAQPWGVADKVIWAGWSHEPAAWFHMADLVVFPSREGETLGNVILEAWSFQKPLVTTAFRGAREITQHGVNNWMVPCDDGKALALGVETVLRDDALRSSLAKGGHEKVTQDFSVPSIVGQYQSLYQTLVKA